MRAPRSNPSLTSLVGCGMIVAMYVMSYFMLVSVNRPVVGPATAAYPASLKPIAIVYRPMEWIDQRIRPDVWRYSLPKPV
jgi:hypothetical protein